MITKAIKLGKTKDKLAKRLRRTSWQLKSEFSPNLGRLKNVKVVQETHIVQELIVSIGILLHGVAE